MAAGSAVRCEISKDTVHFVTAEADLCCALTCMFSRFLFHL